MTSTGSLTFTTTMGVINGVHNNTSNLGSSAHPSGTTGLTDFHIHVILVTDLSQSGHTLVEHKPHLTGRHLKSDILAFLSSDKRFASCSSNHLRTTSELKLYAVNGTTYGDILQGKSISNLNRRVGTVVDNGSYLNAFGSNDVALFTVCIVNQSDIGRSVRIVFDLSDLTGDVKLVPSEIDLSVFSLVSSTAAANSNPSSGSATGF